MPKKVGFIGLGVMGGPMAKNVAGHFPIIVYDVESSKMQSIEFAERAGSVEEVAQKADVVLLSLPSTSAVREVAIGSRGLVGAMRSGSVVIDTSTTEPVVSEEVAGVLEGRGIRFLDAPVSGGEQGAKDGSLAFMVGGSETTFKDCLEILKAMGRSVVRVGDVGMGETAKLVNNLIVGITFAAIAEGFALGTRSGLDPEILFHSIRGGWAGSRVLEVCAPAIINRDFTPGGTINIHWKDMGYALAQAKERDVPMPVTALVHEIFKAARAAGRGGLSQPGIITLWEDVMRRKIQ